MAFYENVFIARQDISASQVDGLVQSFTEIVTNGGGKVVNHEYWGLRSLTYRIKKNRKGHYVMLNLDAPSEALAELERLQRLNEDVIRYMSVRIEEISSEPSAMMQNKDRRDEKPRRGGDRGERGDRGDRGGRGHFDSDRRQQSDRNQGDDK